MSAQREVEKEHVFDKSGAKGVENDHKYENNI